MSLKKEQTEKLHTRLDLLSCDVIGLLGIWAWGKWWRTGWGDSMGREWGWWEEEGFRTTRKKIDFSLSTEMSLRRGLVCGKALLAFTSSPRHKPLDETIHTQILWDTAYSVQLVKEREISPEKDRAKESEIKLRRQRAKMLMRAKWVISSCSFWFPRLVTENHVTSTYFICSNVWLYLWGEELSQIIYIHVETWSS